VEEIAISYYAMHHVLNVSEVFGLKNPLCHYGIGGISHSPGFL
jgi:hypothetical protein